VRKCKEKEPGHDGAAAWSHVDVHSISIKSPREVMNAAAAFDWVQMQVHACPLAVILCGEGGHPGLCKLRE